MKKRVFENTVRIRCETVCLVNRQGVTSKRTSLFVNISHFISTEGLVRSHSSACEIYCEQFNTQTLFSWTTSLLPVSVIPQLRHTLPPTLYNRSRLRLKCDGTRAETRFRLSSKQTSPFKSAGASVQSTTGSRGVRIGGSNAEYIMFRGSVKGTGYPLHSPVCPSLPLPCVTVCHHDSTGL